jgi:hypothetical protein
MIKPNFLSPRGIASSVHDPNWICYRNAVFLKRELHVAFQALELGYRVLREAARYNQPRCRTTDC